MIHIYHGHGKGKTTAAIGLAVRAAGAGKKVLFCQFMKGNISSEIPMLKTVPQMQVELVGKAFGFYKNMTEQEKEEITACHNRILQTVLDEIQSTDYGKKNTGAGNSKQTGKHNIGEGEPELVIVLDELTSAYRYGLLDQDLVQKILLLVASMKETDGRETDGQETEQKESDGRESGQQDGQRTQVELVITGRDPDPFFIEQADYITEMKMERHPYEKGILARKGIEW